MTSRHRFLPKRDHILDVLTPTGISIVPGMFSCDLEYTVLISMSSEMDLLVAMRISLGVLGEGARSSWLHYWKLRSDHLKCFDGHGLNRNFLTH